MPTSEPSGCYVYLQLPRSMEVLTCGRFVQHGDVGRFVYGKSYLANPRAVELDKLELPLRPGIFETRQRGGLFGALRDASPGAWGRRIIEHQRGRTDLTEVDLLLHSPEDRVGALSFGPSTTPRAPTHAFNPVHQLGPLLEAAERMEQDPPPAADPVSVSRVDLATAMGGARPKSVVEDGEDLWVARLPARGDRWNNAAVEGGMLKLARECGLRAAYGKVVSVAGRSVLLVRRFDRRRIEEGFLRSRMVSALTVLRASGSPRDCSKASYVLLADELKRWVANPDEDLRELFSRRVFNALLSNIDDPARNQALIAAGTEWNLSPVYGLTPMPRASTEHPRANRQSLLSECGRFRLSREDAGHLIDRMKTTVSARWRDIVKACGGTEADLKAIAPAFDSEGFEDAPTR